MMIPVAVALILASLLTASVFAVKPTQTNQGCQTEGADYLVDVIYSEFGPEIYEAPDEVLIAMMEEMGLNEDAIEAFLALFHIRGTIVGYFGPCCFDGGPITYEGPRDNGFPNDCCKPPDFESFPLPGYVGGGDGNPCLCQSGLHPTPEIRIYGGDFFDSPIVVLNGDAYLKIQTLADEEWIVIPLPPP